MEYGSNSTTATSGGVIEAVSSNARRRREIKRSRLSHGTSRTPLSWLLLASLVLGLCLSLTPAQPAAAATAAATSLHPKGVAWLVAPKWKTGADSYNWQGIESDLKDIQAAGISWVRVIFNENQSFTYSDHLVSLIKQYNISMLVRVMKSYPAKDLGTTTQQANYKAWLNQVVTRYQADIRYWEIQNEPNIPPYWNINHDPNSDPVAYAQSVANYIALLKIAYETIKAIDPNLMVLIGGLCEYRVERYLDELIKQNAYQYFDIMAYHPYALNPDLVIGRLNALKSKMALQPGLKAKPIWITEVGFHTPFPWTAPGLVQTEDIKADYLMQTMQKLSESGVEFPIFWFDFSEADSNINGFGLVRKDNTTLATTYLPAYDAYKDLWVTKFLKFLTPVADTYVSSSSPTTNFGTASQIRVNNASTDIKKAYLKFDLTSLAGKTLYQAQFRIQTVNDPSSGSTSTQKVKLVDDVAWQEKTITYNSRPAIGATVLGSIANTTKPTWYQLPLDFVPLQAKLGQLLSLGIDSTGSDDLAFRSRESSTRPQLLLYYTEPQP